MSVKALFGALRPRSALELVVVVAVSLLALELKGLAEWAADLLISAAAGLTGRSRPATGPAPARRGGRTFPRPRLRRPIARRRPRLGRHGPGARSAHGPLPAAPRAGFDDQSGLDPGC